MSYEAPQAYADLIEPRYAPIADALTDAAGPKADDDALELGAGTGLVTRRIAGKVGSLIATDLSPSMLEVARSSARATYLVLDYNKPLPFLDGSFDLVLSGLTYVQDTRRPLAEITRVLRPGGRLALAMWGARYHELNMLRDAVTALGRPRLPSPAPGPAVKRLERAGFADICRRDLELQSDFQNVEAYLEYRRAFGRPPGASQALHTQYLRCIERRAQADSLPNGRLRIGWTLTILTARRGSGAGPGRSTARERSLLSVT